MLRNFFSKFSNKLILGRWSHNIPDKQKNIRAIWANSDHCGDIICGDPKKVKDIINKTQNNKNVKYVSIKI
jgi:hypothetical protein